MLFYLNMIIPMLYAFIIVLIYHILGLTKAENTKESEIGRNSSSKT